MSDNDITSISDMLAEARLLCLLIRGTKNETGLLSEIEKSRATAEAIASAVAESKHINAESWEAVAELRDAIEGISKKVQDTLKTAASDLGVIDSIRNTCVTMSKLAISESAAASLREAADKVQNEIDVDLGKIAVGKFGVKTTSELVGAWVEYEECKKRNAALEAETNKLRERLTLFDETNNNREPIVNTLQWTVTAALAGALGGGIAAALITWQLLTGGG